MKTMEGIPMIISKRTVFYLVAGFVCTPALLASAAPLPNGSTKLTITPGVTSSDALLCLSGSCFGVDDLGFTVWSPIVPGTDGGIILGKNQKTGGQETGPSATITTSGELTAAWPWFMNYGTFATAPISGAFGEIITNGASLNQFDSASCSGAGCLGKTTLGTWNVAWNGSASRAGSADGCTNPLCTPDQLAGIGVTNWTVGPDNSYVLDYSWFTSFVPQGGLFNHVPIRLHLEGAIVAIPDISGAWQAEGEGSTVMFVFGENFALLPQDNQVTVNGTSNTNIQVMNKRLLLVLLPSKIEPPFVVTVTTSSDTAIFPKPCL